MQNRRLRCPKIENKTPFSNQIGALIGWSSQEKKDPDNFYPLGDFRPRIREHEQKTVGVGSSPRFAHA